MCSIVKVCDVCEHFVNIFTPIFTPMWKSQWNHKNLCFPRESMVHTGVNTPWELRENSVGSPSCENNVKWCKILWKYCELLWKWYGNFGKHRETIWKYYAMMRKYCEKIAKHYGNGVEIMWRYRGIIWKQCAMIRQYCGKVRNSGEVI